MIKCRQTTKIWQNIRKINSRKRKCWQNNNNKIYAKMSTKRRVEEEGKRTGRRGEGGVGNLEGKEEEEEENKVLL